MKRVLTLPLIAVACLTMFSVFAVNAMAQATHYPPEGPNGDQFPSPACLALHNTYQAMVNGGIYNPCPPGTHEAWLKDITHWRMEHKIRIGFNDRLYNLPALKWTQSSFMQPQMMVEDRYLYDPSTGKYTVDRYLDDVDKRYGGIDAVLIWSTYPNMGIDARNQIQMVESMPGGIAGVKQMVADFHRHGVRVLFPMMMWDQGTHDPGMPWPEAIAKFMKEIGADGINGDTQRGVPEDFSLAAEKIGHPLAFEPEDPSANADMLSWNVMSWGHFDFTFVPGVDVRKWIEPRHMVNISDRWARNKTDDLQFAFFNGIGWESWENIWGIWNGITPRDGEATRRVATIERGVAPFLVSQGWEPLYPMLRYGVFSSRWPLGDKNVWTIVNRNEYDISGREMSVPYRAGMHYFDLYHGVELTPDREGDKVVLSFPMEAYGYGAVLATPGEPDAAIESLMARMKKMTVRPLSSYPDIWKPLSQTMVPIAQTAPAATTPPGMIKIPGGDFVFKVRGIEIEGGNWVEVDVQYPWEDMPRRFHEHKMHIHSFYIDKYPVTNAQYKKFLDATHYHPKDDLNFLKDWKDGTYPAGWGNKPVTWVSIEDARAYAHWAGKRLPHEWEWQYAAQGTDGRIYPWGNTWETSAVPTPDKGRSLTGPADVDANPAGASPFGVMDMVGNVWQWTDVFEDEHTRAAILRGGSYYQPQGSLWYFPQAYRNDEHGKFLMMAPSYDRSGTVGFRCAEDAP